MSNAEDKTLCAYQEEGYIQTKFHGSIVPSFLLGRSP